MKKSISLALVLVMVLSSFVITSGMAVTASAEPAAYQEISLLDKIAVLDSNVTVTNFQGNQVKSQSAEMDQVDGNYSLLFHGPSSEGGDAYPRALCKLDEGVAISGYTFLFIQIRFGDDYGFRAGNELLQPWIEFGFANAADAASPSGNTVRGYTTLLNDSDEAMAAWTGHIGITNVAEIQGTEQTWVVIVPTATATYLTHIYLYAVGWRGVSDSTKDIEVTSMWLANASRAKGIGAQQSMDIGATQDIRFVSVLGSDDLGVYSAVGYEISVNGGEVETVEGSTVYTKVIGQGEAYQPSNFGGSYFFTVCIENVPVGTEWNFTVVPYVKTVRGEVIKSCPMNFTVGTDGVLS